MTAAEWGSYAIATVCIGGAQADGTPAAFTTSAVCDVCGNWATDLCTAGKTTTKGGDFINSRVSRRLEVVAYACPNHYEDVLNSLVEEFGGACNVYEPNELAMKINRVSAQRFAEERDRQSD